MPIKSLSDPVKLRNITAIFSPWYHTAAEISFIVGDELSNLRYNLKSTKIKAFVSYGRKGGGDNFDNSRTMIVSLLFVYYNMPRYFNITAITDTNHILTGEITLYRGE